MMEYKGYTGIVEFDDEEDVFYGKVINLRDLITFEGTTVVQLRKSFRDSVDDYLEFCASRGEEPEKPYSGKFMIRVEPELHKKLATRARVEQKSLNAWVEQTLEQAVHEDEAQYSAPKPKRSRSRSKA